jgi:enterochelin esterase-like enzyme
MSGLRDRQDWPRGEIQHLSHRSEILKDNPWGDPSSRSVCIYLPHDYSEEGLPSVALWDLAAFTNSGPGHLNWRSHGENLPDRLDRLIGSGGMPACVVVMPDCYTSLGGNQYLNSPAVGRYADYLVEELVPFVSNHVNVVDHRDGRGLFGKSSGGYGAIYLALHFPETWGALASHAGDVGFELVYRPEFAIACNVLAEFDGDIEAFIRSFWKKNRPDNREYSTLLTVAMAASYDPDPDNPRQIRLPFDLRTCEIDDVRWKNWLAHDPLNMVERGAEALRSLHALYIDAGSYDQFRIQFGTRALVDRLESLNVDFHYEEFEGSHTSIDWRLDVSLPLLANALKKAARGSS